MKPFMDARDRYVSDGAAWSGGGVDSANPGADDAPVSHRDRDRGSGRLWRFPPNRPTTMMTVHHHDLQAEHKARPRDVGDEGAPGRASRTFGRYSIRRPWRPPSSASPGRCSDEAAGDAGAWQWGPPMLSVSSGAASASTKFKNHSPNHDLDAARLRVDVRLPLWLERRLQLGGRLGGRGLVQESRPAPP